MNTPQHGRNHGEESLPSSQLKKKMFICAFENFHVSHFISNYLKTSPLPTGLQGLPDPTELSSPRSTWRPGLGLFLCLTGLCTQPTPLPEGRTPTEIVVPLEGRWLHREKGGHIWRAGPSTPQAKDEQLCEKSHSGHRPSFLLPQRLAPWP